MAGKGKNSAGKKGTTSGESRPSVVIYWIIAVVALIGLADATFLTVAHLTGDDAVCGTAVGCSTVLGSSYATIKGAPTAAFGTVAYFTVFSLAILGAFRAVWVRKFLMFVVAAMFVASCYFLYLQAFVIHAYCPYCMLSAALTFFLAGLLLVIPPAR